MAKTAKRTDPELWSKIVADIKRGDRGGRPGQWSARKAQLAVKEYKDAGGRYVGKKSSELSLAKWTRQDWRTKSGKPSLETGERYLPAKAIKALSSAEYAATTREKRKVLRRGQQFSRQPMSIARKVKPFRKNAASFALPFAILAGAMVVGLSSGLLGQDAARLFA